MAADQSSIHKFHALLALDEFFSSTDPATRDRHYDAALARLDDPAFDILGRTVAGIESAPTSPGARAHLDHFQAHWLSDQAFPGTSAEAVSTTIRAGFRDAIKDAKDAGLPLNAVWVSAGAGAKADAFRVDHVVGPVCVTVAIIAPPPGAA